MGHVWQDDFSLMASNAMVVGFDTKDWAQGCRWDYPQAGPDMILVRNLFVLVSVSLSTVDGKTPVVVDILRHSLPRMLVNF